MEQLKTNNKKLLSAKETPSKLKEIEIPNHITRKAISDARQEKTSKVDSIKQLFDKLKK